MTSRRTFLAGALALPAAPLAAQDKPAPKRIGLLETLPIRMNNAHLVEFHKGMKELGHEEGQSYIVLYRSAEGRAERFPALAAELARLKVDVFLTRGTPATLAARDTESGIPVVASAIAEPIDQVTGLSSSVAELGAMRLELLKALAPGITGGGVCRQEPEGHEARRSAGGAREQVRAGDQPQDRARSEDHDPAGSLPALGRSDRLMRGTPRKGPPLCGLFCGRSMPGGEIRGC